MSDDSLRIFRPGEEPEGFIPAHRPRQEGRIRHDLRIPRYWISRQTGVQVEVRRYLLIDGEEHRIIYHHPVYDREFSAPRKEFEKKYQPYGNLSSKY